MSMDESDITEIDDDMDEIAEDDFGDDAMGDDMDYGEDEDISGDDWDSYDEDYGEEKDAPAGKKKKSKFDKIIIGLAVVIGAGFFAFKTGILGGGTAPSPAPVQQQAAATSQPSQQSPAVAATAPMTQRDMIYGATLDAQDAQRAKEIADRPKGMLLDKGLLEDMQRNADIASDEAWSSYYEEGEEILQPDTSDELYPVEGNTEIETPAQFEFDGTAKYLDGSGGNAPDESGPQLDTAYDGLFPTPLPEGLEPSANLPTAQDIVINAPAGNGTPASKDKIDQIFDRLDGLEEKISAIQDAQQNKVAIEGLEKSVASLTKRLDRLSKEPPKVSASVSDASKPKTTRKTIPSLSRGESWVLKGAKPGQAWLSRKGSSEIHSIGVGDTLPDIGRIVSIENKKGKWVVEGANGSVNQ